MIINDKNQNNIISSELINSYDINYVFSNEPINRVKNTSDKENKYSLG